MKKGFFLFLLTLPAFFSNAQNVDEVVVNYINAMGGSEKLAAIQSIKMIGTLSVQGLSVDVTVTALNEKGARTDIAVPGMGEGFQIYTPVKGWSYMPFQGQLSVEEMPEDQLKNGLTQLDVQGPLYNYKTKGNKVELIGKEMFDGMDCYKLKVETTHGKVSTYFIDSKTYYRVKVLSEGPTGNEIETIYSNFKKTEQGYTFPFSQTNPAGTIEFSTIEVNKPVNENIFTVS